MTASSSTAWTTRMPASSPSPSPILMGNRRWPSSTGRSFPGLVLRKRSANRRPASVDLHRESIWISYCPLGRVGDEPYHLCHFALHNRLASPVAPWEQLKIGGGTPPILTRHGWMVIYHGVHELAEPSAAAHKLCYSAGVLILSEEHPRVIRYRSPEPVLTPQYPQERIGTVANVVFPTAIDRRDDLGLPDRFDVYYGMADNRIGVARLDVPEFLPPGGLADPSRARGSLLADGQSQTESRQPGPDHDQRRFIATMTSLGHHRSAPDYRRSARTGRTLRQHPALPGRGRRAEGQVRAPRPAPGFGGHGLRALGSLRSSSTRVIPSGPTGTGSSSRPDMDVRCCTPCSMSRASTCPWRSSRGSASGEAAPRAIRSTARPPASRPPPAPGAGPGQRRRHGHRRGGPRGALQSTGSPDRGPLHLRPGQRWRPGGRDLFRGRIGGRSPAAGQAHRPLCRQPHHDRRQHGAGLHRRPYGPFRRVRLARPARSNRATTSTRSPMRWRRPGKRRAGPP